MENKNTYIYLITTIAMSAWIVAYLCLNCALGQFRPTSFMTMLLLYPVLIFLTISDKEHQRGLVVDKVASLFWLTFMLIYSGIAYYLHAVPSTITIVLGLVVYVFYAWARGFGFQQLGNSGQQDDA